MTSAYKVLLLRNASLNQDVLEAAQVIKARARPNLRRNACKSLGFLGKCACSNNEGGMCLVKGVLIIDIREEREATKVALNKNIQLRCGMCSRIKLTQRLCKNAHKWQLFKGNCTGQIKVMVDVVNAVSIQLVRNAWQGSLNLKARRTLSTSTDITEREGRQLS